jgi:hypothetical protein
MLAVAGVADVVKFLYTPSPGYVRHPAEASRAINMVVTMR